MVIAKRTKKQKELATNLRSFGITQGAMNKAFKENMEKMVRWEYDAKKNQSVQDAVLARGWEAPLSAQRKKLLMLEFNERLT